MFVKIRDFLHILVGFAPIVYLQFFANEFDRFDPMYRGLAGFSIAAGLYVFLSYICNDSKPDMIKNRSIMPFWLFFIIGFVLSYTPFILTAFVFANRDISDLEVYIMEYFDLGLTTLLFFGSLWLLFFKRYEEIVSRFEKEENN